MLIIDRYKMADQVARNYDYYRGMDIGTAPIVHAARINLRDTFYLLSWSKGACRVRRTFTRQRRLLKSERSLKKSMAREKDRRDICVQLMAALVGVPSGSDRWLRKRYPVEFEQLIVHMYPGGDPT